MCLGIPGRVVEIHDDRGLTMGVVDFGGVRREVCLTYVEREISPGDHVIVHVGFAISRVDEDEAGRTLTLLREMMSLDGPRGAEEASGTRESRPTTAAADPDPESFSVPGERTLK